MADQTQIYTVEIDGKQYDVEGSRPPTEAEARSAIGEYSKPQSDSGALGMAAVKPAAGLMMEMATNPGFPKATATLGRIGGAILPMAVGSKYGASGMASGALGAAAGSWSGGKTGYFTGKLLQNIASPVARGLEAVAPAANVLAGASGVGDLAQMAEPNRRDIGFLGLGPSVDVPGAEPPLINGLIDRIRARFGHR